MANPFHHLTTRIDRGRLPVDNDLNPRTLAITPEGYLTFAPGPGKQGVESEGNSSTDVLTAGETFTGEWELIKDYAIIKVFISSDQAGAIGGLIFQQSPDMVDIDNEVYEYTNSTPKLFTPNPVAKYFRILYTNGTADQTRFSLATIYSYVYAKPTSHRLGDRVTGNDDAELTKSVVAFRDENDDTYHNIGTQHAMPVDSGSIFAHNIWEDESVVTDWVDLDNIGEHVIVIPYTNLHTRIRNTTSDNPKTIITHFNRTVNAQQVGIGCTGGGDFSNVKLTLIGSGGVTRTLLDDSTNNTKYTSKNYEFPPQLFNALKMEFFTADTVTISNITIQKAIITESQIKGSQPDGNLIPIGATPSGNLKVSDAENGLAIAKGDVVGSTTIHKFGKAPDFDIVDGYVSMWDGASSLGLNAMLYTYSLTAIIDSLSSSSTGDTQLIEVQGLDVNYNLVIQTIALTGQTRVALTTSLIRVFRLKNVGSTDLAGDVFCFENTPLTAGVPIDETKCRASISIGNNQTLMAIYTVPAGYTAYMRVWFASLAGAKRVNVSNIRMFARPFGQVFQLKHDASINASGSSNMPHLYAEPKKFAEKTDIEIRCNTDENDAGVSGGFDLVLIEN